ncbi:MAG TPA: class I SAM-dependent methyltransferase [Fimbriimonadaceae bacterium]|nr:class I SAM-dependent methyltransferase [Fimbriimonadaceae bacterium]
MEMTIEEFNRVVEADWAGDETAAAWKRHYAPMKEQLAAITSALVDAADARPGMRILDLASGTGEPSLSIGRCVAPGGTVVATDLSGAMLAFLEENARAEGVDNVSTQVLDAQDIPFADASFDRVTSRFGIMFFGDTPRALGEIRRVLKPGGKAVFMVWGMPAPKSYFGTSVLPYMKRLAQMPDPDGPSPMRYAAPGKLAALVSRAGFHEVREHAETYPAPYRGTPEQLLTKMMEIAAPFRSAADSLSVEDRKAAENEVFGNLGPLYDGTFTNVTAPVLIVSGTAPL